MKDAAMGSDEMLMVAGSNSSEGVEYSITVQGDVRVIMLAGDEGSRRHDEVYVLREQLSKTVDAATVTPIMDAFGSLGWYSVTGSLGPRFEDAAALDVVATVLNFFGSERFSR